MKNLLSLFLITITLISCNTKNSKKLENAPSVTKTNLSTPQKIANANGYKHWKEVTEIAFTFNVNRAGNHFERAWVWNPKTAAIKMITAEDTISYNRSNMDSLTLKTDAAFINDKYWLLAPYQLVWDEGTTFTEKENAVAPISKDTLQQLTIIYNNEGGYTPGDAYDFFYDSNYKIKEWNYRKENSDIPTMSTTWEDYEKFNGIEIAKTHQDSTGNFKLYFTNISVKKETKN